VLRREAFHTSPQPPHRQYALSSGFRDVVEIARDLQAGQTMGIVTGGGADDRSAPPL